MERASRRHLRPSKRSQHETLPIGYQAKVTGSAQAFREAFENLIFALILGIAVAYMVLASQFNSFIHPVTVLMALPFSLSGALMRSCISRTSRLSLFSMIGLILLMGIVKKNSILLVDFTNQRRAEGLDRRAPSGSMPHSIASHSDDIGRHHRGRDPGALNFGPGAETRMPMAVSIIGGVTISTLLTLYVVPCVYSIFTRFERPESPEILKSPPQ